jgi:hypothetical protein
MRTIISNVSPMGGQTLTDFPVLVRITNNNLLKNNFSDSGKELTFVGMDGVQLFHEIEDCDASTGTILAWVCLPSFTNKSAFYLYYKNAFATSYSFNGSNTTFSLNTSLSTLRSRDIASNVWDASYRLVLHFAETSGSPVDSSRYNLTPVGTGGANITGSNGYLGKSLYVNLPTADNTLANVPIRYSYAGFSPVPQQFSISLWINTRSPTNYLASGYTGAYSYFANGSTSGVGLLRWGFNELPVAISYGVSCAPTAWNPNAFNRWTFVTMAATVVTKGPVVTNGTNYLITNGVIAKVNTSLQSMIMSYVPTSDLTIGGSSPGLYSAPGGYDEFRLSHSNRGVPWLLTEYSNQVLADTNLFYYVGGLEAGPLTSHLTNEASSPLPYIGKPVRLLLDSNSLSVPYRGPNYITNIFWTSTNHLGIGFTTNFSYTSDATLYDWSLQYSVAGLYSNYAIVSDVSNGVFTNSAVGLLIYNQANFDLRNLSYKQTNQGFVFDLFGSNKSLASISSLSCKRNGKTISLIPLGGNLFLDNQFLFYRENYAYDFTVNFPEITFTNSIAAVGSEPLVSSNLILATNDSLLQNFDYQFQFSSGLLSKNTLYTLNKSLQSKVNRNSPNLKNAYHEYSVRNEDNQRTSFDSAVTVRSSLPIKNGNILLPDYLEPVPLTLEDRNRLSLATWDGSAWHTLPTTSQITNTALLLYSSLYNEGTIGIVVLGDNNALEQPQLRSRILSPSSDQPNLYQLSIYFSRNENEVVSFSVLSDRGKLIYQEKSVLGNFVTWNTKSHERLLSPGAYVYLLKISGTKSRQYSGSFVVMTP